MSNSGRSILAAFAGLAALITAFATGLYLDELTQIDDQQDTTENAAADSSKSPNPAFGTPRIAAPPADNVTVSTQDQSYYNREDLSAQREMAKWTERMGQAAIAGVFLSIIGVWLIWQTWDATRKAAKTSQNTYDAFIALERARLSVFIEEVNFVGQSASVDIGVTNIGKSACVVTSLLWEWSDSEKWPDGSILTGPPRHELVEESKTELLGFIQQDEFEHPVLRGVVKYRSPLGKDHKSFFAFKIWQTRDLPYSLHHKRLSDTPEDT